MTPICTCGHLHQAHTADGCQISWGCPCTGYISEPYASDEPTRESPRISTKTVEYPPIHVTSRPIAPRSSPFQASSPPRTMRREAMRPLAMRDSEDARCLVPHQCPRLSPDRSMSSIPVGGALEARPGMLTREILKPRYPAPDMRLTFSNAWCAMARGSVERFGGVRGRGIGRPGFAR